MAKDKKKSKSVKGTEPPPAAKPKRAAAKKGGSDKAGKLTKTAKRIAQDPATAEVVAATLVAAAAALRNPDRARALATEAADDLKKAARTGADGGALWQLALDVARRSIDALGEQTGEDKAKKTGSKKKKK